MKIFCIYVTFFLILIQFNISEAGLSKIDKIKIEVNTTIKDEAKIKSISINELRDELYLSIKSRLPYITISDNAEYTLLLEFYTGPLVLGIGDKKYDSYSIVLSLRSTDCFYDDVSPYQKIYWQQGIQSAPSNMSIISSEIKEGIKSLIDNFDKYWYEDQDNENSKAQKK